VRQRLQIFSCVLAWFIATGCQWDLAQIVAWGRMFAGYSQEMPLTAAAEKTFSGEMCALCKAVQKAKQEQDASAPKSAPTKAPGKLLDAGPLAAVARVVSPVREVVGLIQPPAALTGRDRTPPPYPPPRAVA
jgi:hypothetical protein